MSCGVCEAVVPKYKCPKCRTPYCSVACCKKHKEVDCSPTEPPKVFEDKTGTLSTFQFPTADTVPLDRLKMLEDSDGVKDCLKNPHLRSILSELDKCDAPDRIMNHFMREPIFMEFVEECLKIVEPKEAKNGLT